MSATKKLLGVWVGTILPYWLGEILVITWVRLQFLFQNHPLARYLVAILQGHVDLLTPEDGTRIHWTMTSIFSFDLRLPPNRKPKRTLPFQKTSPVKFPSNIWDNAFYWGSISFLWISQTFPAQLLSGGSRHIQCFRLQGGMLSNGLGRGTTWRG